MPDSSWEDPAVTEGELMQLLVENVVDYAIFALDRDGCVRTWNGAAERLLGYREDEILGKPFSIFFTEEDVRAGVPERELREAAGQQRANDDRWHLKKGGEPFWAGGSLSPLLDADGHLFGYAKIMRDRSDWKRHEQAVEQRLMSGQEFLRALLENVQTGIVACDADGKLTLFNEVTRQLHGIPREAVGPEEWASHYRLFEPDGETPMATEHIPLYRALRGEQVHNAELVIRPQNGPARLLLSSGRAIYDGNGRKLGAVVSMQDITDRRDAEEALRNAQEELELRVEQRTRELGRANAALRQSEDKWRLLADTIPQLAWMARHDGHIFWYNRRWYEYTGTTPDRVEGWGWQSVHDPQLLPTILERWKASLSTGEPFDMVVPLRGADHNFRPFLTRAHPLRDRDGRVLFWFGTNTDISEQVAAQETLRQSELEHRLLSEVSAALVNSLHHRSILTQVAELAIPALGDLCFFDVLTEEGSLERIGHEATDHGGRAIEFAAAIEPTTGHPIYKVVTAGVSEFVSEMADDWLEAAVEEANDLAFLRECGVASLMSVAMQVGDRRLGAVTFCHTRSGTRHSRSDLRLAEEIARRTALVVENVKLYEKLQETDRRKDEFLATLAHELRNPLAPIRNSLEILKMPEIDPAMVRETHDLMERQVHHLVRLVDDLLDVSRVMRGKIELRKELIELAAVVARAVETAQPLMVAQMHKLEVCLPEMPLYLQADPIRLAQVISNLLTNAAKYTEPGGQIRLEAHREGNVLVLRVSDNGIGIDREVLPHIFALFVQVDHAAARSQGGLGIGLTLVRNLVEMHHGRVEAHSDGLGTGSEFVVRLPLAEPRSAAPENSDLTATDRHDAMKHRLLVIDDNHDAADTMAMLLTLRGYDVRVAHDGHNGIQLVESFRPTMVFLDLGMPGMDGFEVARRIRKLPGGDRIILTALTGWGQEADRRRTAEAGFDHHLVKPPEAEAVMKLLRELDSES